MNTEHLHPNAPCGRVALYCPFKQTVTTKEPVFTPTQGSSWGQQTSENSSLAQ